MIDWLYTFHDSTLAVMFAALLATPIVILPRLLRYVPVLAPSPENTDFVLRIQSTLFTMSSLVMAFSLVQAQANLHQTESMVSAESSSINNLDRLLTRYGDNVAMAARPLLLAYAQSIVTDDWPAMIQGRDSEATRLAYRPLSRSILAINPPPGRQTLIFSEILKAVDSIAEMREARHAAASIGLPAIYWIAVFFAVGVLILAYCTVEQTPFRTVMLTAQAAVLGVFLGVVFITDQPFKGETSVGPDGIIKVIAAMKARDS